jgi:hypothetical protein
MRAVRWLLMEAWAAVMLLWLIVRRPRDVQEAIERSESDE